MLTKEKMEKLKITGYRVATKTENTTSGPGKGSLILISDKYNAKPLKNSSAKSGFELIGVAVSGSTTHKFKKPLHIWSCYCSPSVKGTKDIAKKKLLSLFKDTKSSKYDFILAGDLNCNMALSKNKVTTSNKLKEWLMGMDEKDEIDIINDYTSTMKKSNSILDIAITKLKDAFATPLCVDIHSDHLPLIVGFSNGKSNSEHSYYSRVRYMRDEQTRMKVRGLCKELNLKAQGLSANTLTKEILNIWKNNARRRNIAKRPGSKTSKRKAKQKPWWNEELKSLFRAKQGILLMAKSSSTDLKPLLEKQAQEINDELQDKLKDAQNKYFQEFASKLDHRYNSEVFKIAKNIGAQPSPTLATVSILKEDGSVVTDMKTKARVLAEQYKQPLGKQR